MRRGPLEITRQGVRLDGHLHVRDDLEVAGAARPRRGLALADGPLVVGGDPGEVTDVLASRGPGQSPLWMPAAQVIGGSAGDVQQVTSTVSTTIDDVLPPIPIEGLSFPVTSGEQYSVEVLLLVGGTGVQSSGIRVVALPATMVMWAWQMQVNAAFEYAVGAFGGGITPGPPDRGDITYLHGWAAIAMGDETEITVGAKQASFGPSYEILAGSQVRWARAGFTGVDL